MDLRKRLTAWLAGFSVLLLICVSAYWLNAARDDAREELRASEQLLALIDILARQDASPATSAAQIRALVQAGGFRHLSLHLGEPPASSEQHWLRPLANQIDFNRQSTQLTLEGQRVSIQLEPYSEIEEKIRDASGMILFTVLISAISIVACWITIGRALAPAQRIEAALHALEDDAPIQLPHFPLREFDRIAHTLNALSAKLHTARQRQRQLSRRLLAVREQEQAELARELHDELGQSLEAIGVCAAYLVRHGPADDTHPLQQCARDIQGETQRIHAHIRALLGELRPHGLDGLALKDALDELASQWQARLPHIDLRYDWSQLPTLPGPHALPAYRAVQECLTNIARHSQASQVSLLGEQDGDWAVLTLRDNGVAHTPPKYGCGLLGMQERLASIGGDMSARPHPDGGLLVVVRVPVLGLS